MSGGVWWAWVAICVAAWFAAVFFLGAWLDHDDDLAEYRWPIDDEDGDR